MDNAPLAVYIHWPYCARICPYCDFNVYKRKPDDGLMAAILTDLSYWRDRSGPRQITSIHFGGGTPSLLRPDQIRAVIDQVDQLWGVDNIEIALEANPNDAPNGDYKPFAKAGINRLSLGVQSFDDDGLKKLGRDHSADQAINVIDQALDVFPSVSADLIFGWSDQSRQSLERDLDILLEKGVHHFSTYQLTIEAGTAFAIAEARGDRRAIDPDKSAEFYDYIRDRLCASGFDHYEVSNFARASHQSQHNLAYWRAHDYVGVGPGAHGRLTLGDKKEATIAYMRPGQYKEQIKQNGHGIETRDLLTSQERAEEYLLMGLRIEAGISLKTYSQYADQPLDESLMAELAEMGFLVRNDDHLKMTTSGRLVLDHITERLLVG